MIKVSKKEAQEKQYQRKKKSKVLEKYKQYILSLNSGEAGKFLVKSQKEGYQIRNALKRAADALNIKIKVKKVRSEMFFWILDDSVRK